MSDLVQPLFDWGRQVAPAHDLLNDGSYPELPEGEVLVPAGLTGSVVRVGLHEVLNLPLYLVEFSNGRVVGCFEHELAGVDTPSLATAAEGQAS